MGKVVLSCAVVLVLAGCVTTGGNTGGPSPFTSAEELKKLTAGPRPERVFTKTTADVAQWTLLGPFPGEVSLAPHESESAAGKMINEEATRRGAVPTAGLACAARELAHFVVEKREQPPSLLREAIAGRCALGTTQLAANWLELQTGDATDGDLIALAMPRLLPSMERMGPSTFVGAALSRSGKTGVLVVVSTQARGTLEPVSVFPGPDGAVTLHGTTEPGMVAVVGVVTRGEVGTATCVDLHQRALPQYDLRCPIEATDATAWISVATLAQGRLLLQELRRLLVWPSRSTSTSWALPQLIPAGIAPTVEALTAELNALRAGAGMRALEGSAAQTADLNEVAPFLFQAVVTGDTLTADQIGLGIIAGWRVEKDITWGNFGAEVSERDDGSLLLTHALLSPATRAMLFDPQATLLGLGLYRESGGLGAVFSVYKGLEAPAFPGAVEALVKRLDAARARVSRGPTKWARLPANAELGLAAAISTHKLEPRDALNELMEASVAATGRGVRGFSIETASLEDVPWPAELINAPALELSIVAASLRSPRAPWAHFVVMFAQPQAQ